MNHPKPQVPAFNAKKGENISLSIPLYSSEYKTVKDDESTPTDHNKKRRDTPRPVVPSTQ